MHVVLWGRQMAASEASQETDGTLTICCERVTSLERDVAELRRELRVLASRVDASVLLVAPAEP